MSEVMELPEPESDDNVVRAIHWHNVALKCGNSTLEAAARAGEALAEQRDMCSQTKNGPSFSKWCDENLPFSRTHANRYIAIADNWVHVEHACSTSDEPISMRGVLRLVEREKGNGKRASQNDLPSDYSPAGKPSRKRRHKPKPEPDHVSDAGEKVNSADRPPETIGDSQAFPPPVEVVPDDTTTVEYVIGSINHTGKVIDGFAATEEGRYVHLSKAHDHLGLVKKVIAGGNRPNVLAEDVTMPEGLDTPDCRDSLSEWLTYKRKRGGGYKTVNGVEKQLDRLSDLGPMAFCQAVEYSIAQNYQGIFAEKSAHNGKHEQFSGIKEWLDEQ